jgi:hypothetical protein
MAVARRFPVHFVYLAFVGCVLITVKSEHTATGIYGFEKPFTRIAIAVDEPALFSAALTGDQASSEGMEESS